MVSRKEEIALKLLEKRESSILAPKREELPVVVADANLGLNSAQVAERMEKGYANINIDPPTKTVKQIVRDNLLTYFNFVFFFLAGCIIAVGS